MMSVAVFVITSLHGLLLLSRKQYKIEFEKQNELHIFTVLCNEHNNKHPFLTWMHSLSVKKKKTL